MQKEGCERDNRRSRFFCLSPHFYWFIFTLRNRNSHLSTNNNREILADGKGVRLLHLSDHNVFSILSNLCLLCLVCACLYCVPLCFARQLLTSNQIHRIAKDARVPTSLSSSSSSSKQVFRALPKATQVFRTLSKATQVFQALPKATQVFRLRLKQSKPLDSV